MMSNQKASSGEKYDTGFALDRPVTKRLSPSDTTHKTKRILTLDGGGVRGAITLGILSRIETVLGAQWAAATGHSSDTFRLWHYFDWIVGTSTGSIIACLLAAGLKVDDIIALYKSFSAKIFDKVPTDAQLATASMEGLFDLDRLPTLLDAELRKIPGWPEDAICKLKDAPLKTGLGILLRRIDTDHTWLAHNHPEAKFFADNSEIPLVTLVSASTAAPPYFKPVSIKVRKINGLFIDGGLSAFNNPSLGALIIATLKEQAKGHTKHKAVYRGFRWDMGDDKLLLVSVGTGWLKSTRDASDLLSPVSGWRPSGWAKNRMLSRLMNPMLTALMGDANFLTQAMLLWMSDSATRPLVHGAAEDFTDEFLHPAVAGGTQRHFLTYLRYDAQLDKDETYPADWRKEKNFEAKKAGYYEMTAAANVDRLVEIGKQVAAHGQGKVKAEHFPAGQTAGAQVNTRQPPPKDFRPVFWNGARDKSS